MQLSKNTSTGKSKSFLIKIALILVILIGAITMLNKIDFPSPNKEIKKNIPNAKLKIIK
jgi:hypothetical protein|tara:strand:- start:290 stop:466 length:177 start_codon:yes stop_codon:yes gene_type:complete